MSKLDPRLHAFRDDLAAASLRGQVDATRFVTGTRHQVRPGVVDLRRRPSPKATLDSQLLGGETVQVYDQADGWAWVQNETDGYVGYLPAAALSAEIHGPTHAVKVLRTFVYPEADFKLPPVDCLSMTGRVAVSRETTDFSALAGGGWVCRQHLAPVGETVPDYVATALQFLGVPYLWGGKASLGLDCSALVQLALHRAGLACPRDSDMQAEGLGAARPPDAPPERGDLIYLPDHVAIALDDWRVVHANADDMMVTIEPLADLIGRVERDFGRGVTVVKRPLRTGRSDADLT